MNRILTLSCTVTALCALACAAPVEDQARDIRLLSDQPELPLLGPVEELPCELEGAAWALAGEQAIDCGRAAADDSFATDECAAAALLSDTPFVAFYDFQGYEGVVTDAWLLTPDGEMLVLVWDPVPCGGPSCAPQLHTAVCHEPTIVLAGLPDLVCQSLEHEHTRTCD